eukprot:1806621-Pyramimonas_sp.AAC.1
MARTAPLHLDPITARVGRLTVSACHLLGPASSSRVPLIPARSIRRGLSGFIRGFSRTNPKGEHYSGSPRDVSSSRPIALPASAGPSMWAAVRCVLATREPGRV